MLLSAYTKFYFRPGEGEQLETSIRLLPHRHSAILGSVCNGEGAPVPGALVLLFEGSEDSHDLLSQTCTDEDGQFMFGPLECDRLYMVKICKNAVKTRTLQIKADTYEF